MNDIKGKKILLLYARFFEYDKIVQKQLIKRGAIVDLYDARANISVFEKALLKKTDCFYKRKQIDFHKKICKMNLNKNYDFILTNENLNPIVIDCYRKCFHNAKIILYLDDSVANLRNVNNTFILYDKVLTFDSVDSDKYHILFRPLFFNDYIKEKSTINCKKHYDICFIGTAHSDRVKIIRKIEKTYPHVNFCFYVFLQSKFMYFYYYFKDKNYRHFKYHFFKYRALKMEEVVNLMEESRIVLDIQHPKQTGLTIRTIESIGMKRKIITTNPKIVEYDFYNPKNILIIDRDNPVLDESFFSSDYFDLDNKIYDKYTIDSWINDVFGVKQ